METRLSQERAGMECLRDFLRRELGDKASGLPLGIVIARCYQEVFRRAQNGQKGKVPPALLQEHLRRIAAEFLDEHRRPS